MSAYAVAHIQIDCHGSTDSRIPSADRHELASHRGQFLAVIGVIDAAPGCLYGPTYRPDR